VTAGPAALEKVLMKPRREGQAASPSVVAASVVPLSELLRTGADAVQPFPPSAPHPSCSFGSPGTLNLGEQSRQKMSPVKMGDFLLI